MWLTDSTNLTSFLEQGSTKTAIQADILEVFKVAKEHKLVLIPVHLRREDPRIVMADAGSKWADTDDWSVDKESVARLMAWTRERVEIDLFADTKNTQVSHFFSRYACPGSAGVSALAFPWTKMAAWVCPPVGRVVEVVKKIARATGMTGVLVVPAWKTAIFWPFICPDGEHATECFEEVLVFRPFILQGETNEGENTLMKGFTSFPFMALFIRSEGRGRTVPGRARMPAELR